MTALLLKFSPYIAAVIVIFGAGWYVGGLSPKAALARLQAADWQAKAQGEEAARKAVQAQLAQAQTVSANNSTVIEKLQNENAQIAADRDHNLELARRLLNAQAGPASGAHPMPGTPDYPGTADPGTPSGHGSVEGLLADAAAECDANRAQLDTLIAEIKPQVHL